MARASQAEDGINSLHLEYRVGLEARFREEIARRKSGLMRDPRTDPRRGDVWRKVLKSGVSTRQVANVEPVYGRYYVDYVTGRGEWGSLWDTAWEAWTRGAELVKRGDA